MPRISRSRHGRPAGHNVRAMSHPHEDRLRIPVADLDSEATREALAAAARGVAEHAYSPYSEVRVGAALMDSHGQVFLGCNVENASFGATICAERAALVAAVSAGSQRFHSLSLWASPKARLMPCGMCRQMLVEFAPDLIIEVTSSGAPREQYRLRDLLPGAVRAEHLR